MDVGSKGIEFEVREPSDDKHLGDIFIAKGGITWCQGRTRKENGKTVSWNTFIQWMEGRKKG